MELMICASKETELCSVENTMDVISSGGCEAAEVEKSGHIAAEGRFLRSVRCAHCGRNDNISTEQQSYFNQRAKRQSEILF